VNIHALSVLEYEAALAVVATHAASPLGAQAVRRLAPSDARAWVEPELRRVDQMVAFLLAFDDWAPPSIPDLRQPIQRLAAEGAAWEGAQLRDAAVVLRTARAVPRALLPRSQE
jgi:dsDNA-specific endonuclease/ATPase MutS2